MTTFRIKPIIAALLLFISPAFGQVEKEKIYQGYTRSELIEESSDLMMFLNDILVVSVTTSEISLEQFVDLIQEKSPIHLNVIVMDDAKDIKIPPIKLTNVTAGAVINALRVATNELVTFDYDESGQVGFFGRSEDYVPASEVTVVNLADVLRSFSNESFLSAVEIGMEMMGSDNSSIQMKLHEETSTLFLKGSEKEIEFVMQLVNQMSGHEDHTGQLFGGGGSARTLVDELLGGSGGMIGGGGGGSVLGGLGRGNNRSGGTGSNNGGFRGNSGFGGGPRGGGNRGGGRNNNNNQNSNGGGGNSLSQLLGGDADVGLLNGGGPSNSKQNNK